MSEHQQPSEHLIHKLAANKLFRIILFVQIGIHLSSYIASFIKLIIIEAGGYYDVGVIVFIGLTIVSMPLFAIALWLIQNSLKISKRQRFWGYCFDVVAIVWSMALIKISYFM